MGLAMMDVWIDERDTCVRSQGRLDAFTYVYVYVVIQLLDLELLRCIEFLRRFGVVTKVLGGFCVRDVDLG